MLATLAHSPAVLLAVWLWADPAARRPDVLLALLLSLIGGLTLGALLHRRAATRLASAATECSRELAEARAAARTAELAKGRFLEKISHELRTPLNGILGMAEVLALGEVSPEQVRQLNTLTRSAEKLLRLLEQVLDYSRAQAGSLTLEQKAFSLHGTLRDSLAPWMDEARRNGVRLSQEVPAETPDLLLGDPRRLRQILGHLVENAVKFTATGEVVVRVAHADADLTLEVRDTGVGIPTARQACIFAPFEQGDDSLTRPQGGVGLGLSFAARVVSQLGGGIEFESEEGRGSTFRVRVPAPVAHRHSASPRPALLMIADEAERLRIGGLLQDAGCSVVAVADGQTGLTELVRGMVQGSPFALVVLEDELPDTSARAWLRQIEEGPAKCPAILLRDAPASQADGQCIVLRRRTDEQELRLALTQAAS